MHFPRQSTQAAPGPQGRNEHHVNLRDRLRLLRPGVENQPPNGSAAPPTIPGGERMPFHSIAAAIPGARLIDTPAGRTVCIEHTYSFTDRRGTVPLGTACSVPEVGWSRLLGTGDSESFDVQRAAVIDTETTGLERGTGTYAFLIGIGRFTNDSFRVRQFFMRDYSDEPAVMAAVQQELASIEAIITFNGKTFDWPLLQTRAVLNRLRLPDPLHLDIRHPARRFWNQVVPSCRLVQLESDVLSVHREGDVPGHLIPSLYFDFLRSGYITPLLPVITHNRLDILSTTALAGYLGQAAANPLQASPAGKPLPGSDLYAVGRLLANQGCDDEAVLCYEEALSRGLPHGLRAACRQALGILYKRHGRYDDACRLWQSMISDGEMLVYAHVELAKYYEHQVKDFLKARDWTLRAMDVVYRKRFLQGLRRIRPETQTELADLHHRLERLERRLAQQRDGAGESVPSA